jgi:hypothetical protein
MTLRIYDIQHNNTLYQVPSCRVKYFIYCNVIILSVAMVSVVTWTKIQLFPSWYPELSQEVDGGKFFLEKFNL